MTLRSRVLWMGWRRIFLAGPAQPRIQLAPVDCAPPRCQQLTPHEQARARLFPKAGFHQHALPSFRGSLGRGASASANGGSFLSGRLGCFRNILDQSIGSMRGGPPNMAHRQTGAGLLWGVVMRLPADLGLPRRLQLPSMPARFLPATLRAQQRRLALFSEAVRRYTATSRPSCGLHLTPSRPSPARLAFR